jgi:Mg-chelatase subunit ChlD
VSFLTPLYLAGLTAIALPVLFHLIRRTPRGRVPFSTLMFLQPSPPRVTRRSRLEHWPLLLLRALALCLLAAAFSRPFWRETMLRNADDAGRMVALLIDTSASMRRDDLWTQVRQAAERTFEELQPHDRLGVFAFDRTLRTIVGFDESTAMNSVAARELAGRRLAELSPGWAGTHLGAALIGVADAIEAARHSRGDSNPAEVILVTDLQTGSRLDELEHYAWPASITVQVRRVHAAKPTNAGLQLAASNAESPSGDDPAQIRVSVINSADAQREQFRLAWRVAGTVIPTVPIVDVYVPPGASRIFSLPLPQESTGPRQLVLTGDDHGFDNTVDVIPPQKRNLTVLYLGPDSADDPESPRYYLERALPDTRSLTVKVVSQTAAGPDVLAAGDDLRLVIVAGRAAETSCPGLRRYAANGGTVLVVAHEASDVATFFQLIDEPPRTASEASVDGYAMLAGIDYTHPLFASLVEAQFADFSAIRIWKHRTLDVSDLAEVTIPARFDAGAPAVVERRLGQGRVILFTFGWSPAESQLALSTRFVPMLGGLLGLDRTEPRLRFDVGEPIPLVGADTTNVVIQVPGGSEIQLASHESVFTDTSVPGVYRLPQRASTTQFAVQVPASESRTEPLPLERLEALGVGLSRGTTPAVLRESQRRQVQVQELEQRQKLWRWLLVGALAALLLETWLAGSLTAGSLKDAEAGT